MNIYEKIQNIKSELLRANLKKSGENAFAHFKYYELADFMPTIIEKCKEYKLMTYVSFLVDTAILTAVNCENPEEVIAVYSPMKDLELKGCNEIQALGGVETYQRRYLYMALFDITENDMFDSGNNEQDEKPKKTMSKDLRKALSETKSELPPQQSDYKSELKKAMNYKVKCGMSAQEVTEALKTFCSTKDYTQYTEEEAKQAIEYLNVLA